MTETVLFQWVPNPKALQYTLKVLDISTNIPTIVTTDGAETECEVELGIGNYIATVTPYDGRRIGTPSPPKAFSLVELEELGTTSLIQPEDGLVIEVTEPEVVPVLGGTPRTLIAGISTVASEIVVPVEVSNFVDIGEFALSMSYNTEGSEVLSGAVVTPNTLLEGTFDSVITTGLDGTIDVAWTGNSRYLPDGSSLFTITFDKNPDVNATTQILFDIVTPNACIFYNSDGEMLEPDIAEEAYLNGYINTTVTEDDVPLPVTLLSPSADSIIITDGGTVSLSWDGGPLGALISGFKVSVTKDGVLIKDSILVPKNNDTLVTNYTLTVVTNSIYTWKVVPYNAVGDATDCPWASFTTEDTAQLNVPSPVDVIYPLHHQTWVDKDSVLLQWESDPSATGYLLNLDQVYGVFPGKLTLYDVGNVTEFEITNLPYSQPFSWQVVPYNDYGTARSCPVQNFYTEHPYGNDSPVFTIGQVSTTETSIIVPVTVTGFINMAGIDLRFKFNPDILVCTNITLGDGVLNQFFIPNIAPTMNNENGDHIQCSWFYYDGLTLVDGSTYLNLHFDKVSTGLSTIETVFDIRAEIEILDKSGIRNLIEPYENFFIDGSAEFTV